MKNLRGFKQQLGTAAALAALLALSACGGGGGGSAATPTGTAAVQVTDAPSKDFDHVWVTISELRFHTSNAVAANDPGWLKFPLATPITVDLAALTNGALASAFSGVTLPVGTYQQIRMILVPDNANLAASALAAGLTYNDQVNWTNSLGVGQVAPLEIPRPVEGIALNGSFTVAANTTLQLAVDFDIGHDVVRFLHNGNSAFTLKPNLQYFDLSQVGAINGAVATTSLCTTTTTGCAYNLVIKAEQLSADGSHHVATRYTTTRPDGSFTLYPVRVPAGQTSVNVDVLVRGRNMDTILVRNVPVTAGSTPSTGATSIATLASPLPLTIDTEFTANASAGINPTGAWVNFYQTLPGTGEVPYEVRYRHVNPFTGVFTDPIPLSTGPVQLGSYVAGATPTLVSTPVAQGNGNFLVYAGAPDYTRTAATSGTLMGTAGATPTFTLPATLSVNSAVATANSLSGTITQAVANTYDSGYLVVVRMGTIVDTIPLASVLTANGGTGGSFSVGNLPGGSTASPLPSAYYYVYARVWNSTAPATTTRRIDFSGYADLRTGNATGINATL